MKNLTKAKKNTLNVKKVTVKKKRKQAMLDDDNDIPYCNSESISSIESRTGRGFWGNPSSGYVYDRDN